jgi:phenylpyruvate tautomerase PptA (4-oxalocrotonate tautomerase family)
VPHIIAKVRSGYSRAQRKRLATALSKAIVDALDCPYFDVSVGIEEVRPTDWDERVYKSDILGKLDTLYKHPGQAAPK